MTDLEAFILEAGSNLLRAAELRVEYEEILTREPRMIKDLEESEQAFIDILFQKGIVRWLENLAAKTNIFEWGRTSHSQTCYRLLASYNKGTYYCMLPRGHNGLCESQVDLPGL